MNEKIYREARLDYVENMYKSIVGQILNNKECKHHYVKILSMALLTIEDTLKYENNYESIGKN